MLGATVGTACGVRGAPTSPSPYSLWPSQHSGVSKAVRGPAVQPRGTASPWPELAPVCGGGMGHTLVMEPSGCFCLFECGLGHASFLGSEASLWYPLATAGWTAGPRGSRGSGDRQSPGPCWAGFLSVFPFAKWAWSLCPAAGCAWDGCLAGRLPSSRALPLPMPRWLACHGRGWWCLAVVIFWGGCLGCNVSGLGAALPCPAEGEGPRWVESLWSPSLCPEPPSSGSTSPRPLCLLCVCARGPMSGSWTPHGGGKGCEG